MKRINKKIFLLSFLIIVIISILNLKLIYASGLHTVDHNYINDHIGDKATGLGGAYCAISDDPSGAYYNPAGLVFAFDNQISLSVNNYKYKYIEYEGVVAGESYTQNIASFYPSFFGVVQSLGDFKIGLTIININNEILDQDDYFEPEGAGYKFNMNYNITDNTLMMGLSLAHFFFSDSFAIGATVYGAKRRNEQIANQLFVTIADNSYEIANMYITEDIYLGIGKVGLQFMPIDILSFGFTYEYGYVIVHDRDSQTFIKEGTDGANFAEIYFDRSSKSIEDFEERDGYPMVFRFGGAFFPSKALTVALDLIYHYGNKYYQLDVENTFNAALGVEYYVTKSLPVRLGLFTNYANTPDLVKGAANQDFHVDMYGASLSLSWQTRSSTISLTGTGQRGKGEAQAINNSALIQNVNMYTYSVSLTGSAKY